MKLSFKALFILSIILSATLFSFSSVPTLTVNALGYYTTFAVVQAFWGTLNRTVEVYPGNKNVPLTVVVQNVGTGTSQSPANPLNPIINGIRANLWLPTPNITDVAGTAYSTSSYSSATGVPSGGSFYLTFMLNINATASLGTYLLGLNLKYLVQVGGIWVDGDDRSLTVVIPIFGKCTLAVTTTGNLITAGSSNALYIDILNNGSATTPVLDVSLSLPAPLVLFGDNYWHFTNLAHNATAKIKTQVYAPSSASVGTTYQATLSLAFQTPYGNVRTETHSIGLVVLNVVYPTLTVSIVGSELTAGSMNNLYFTIKNNGSMPITVLDVYLSLPTPLVLSGDNNWHFTDVSPNSAVKIKTDIYVPIVPAGTTYQATLSLTYQTSYGNVRTENHPIGLRVFEAIQPLRMAVSITAHSNLLPGSVNTLTLSILNNQTKPVSFVQALLTLPSGPAGGTPPLIILGDNSWLFPSIDPFQSVTFSAKLMVSSSAAGSNYQLTLTLSYLDFFGITHTESHVFGVLVAGYTSLTVSRVFWGSSAAPIQVQPTDDNQPLTVEIVNSGTVLAQNVTASLIIESPFSYQYTSGGKIIEATNVTSTVGTIMPGGSGLAHFTLSIGADSTKGLYRLKIMLNDLGNSPIQTTVDIPVSGYSDMTLQKVSVLPPQVYPGDKNVDLKVFVINAGNAAAKNVSVTIVRAQYVRPSSGGADSSFIGTVQPGQIVPVDFYIDVDDSAPSPSNPTLIAKIVYGPTRNLEKSEEIPLFLSAKARFGVTSTKIPEIHVSDTGIVILVTFKNNGAEAAQGTSVEIEVPNVFSGTTSDYLGTMEAGEEKTASFVLNIDSNAKIGSYVLTQRMSWSQTGATHLFTQDLSLKLNILENPLSKLLPSIIIILLVIVAAVIIVVAARRRSHSSKMQPKQT